MEADLYMFARNRWPAQAEKSLDAGKLLADRSNIRKRMTAGSGFPHNYFPLVKEQSGMSRSIPSHSCDRNRTESRAKR